MKIFNQWRGYPNGEWGVSLCGCFRGPEFWGFSIFGVVFEWPVKKENPVVTAELLPPE